MNIWKHNGSLYRLDSQLHYKEQSETEKQILDCFPPDVKVCIDYQGENKTNNWDHDVWRVTFYYLKHEYSFTYKTGLGRRFKRNFKDVGIATLPHLASILYSLISDSEANEYSFSEWAENYGYESDSIRSLNIYNECCKTAKELRMIFNPKQLETFKNILQDY